jgi:transcriptional repressor NrdR
MKCPKCACMDDRVVDSRISKEGDSIRRRRECARCNHRFTTYETYLRTEVVVVKRNGVREDFNPAKLYEGIRLACWKRPISEEAIEDIVHRIQTHLDGLQEREISSLQVGQMVMEELQRLDHVAFVRFASVYRRFQDIGEFLEEIASLQDRTEKAEEEERQN